MAEHRFAVLQKYEEKATAFSLHGTRMFFHNLFPYGGK